MSRLKDLFNAAIDMKPEDRVAFLDRECASDPELRRQIANILRAHDESSAPVAGRTGTFAPDEPATGTFGHPEVSTGAHEPQPDAGTVIGGRFKLIELIGEGGMGSVWMAQQTEPVKRAVAVKLIRAGMDSKAVLARFDAERQALAVMDHPNIAKVLDGGVHDGRPYFVMELVKGTPITQFCDERKLTPHQRLELFIPVCQAIQHAHQKGVIHRDIKPNNVLVALYDDRPVPKVIDFGIAKATGATLTDHTLMTGFGAVVGTPEYMSPEQASLNNLDIDTRSDVYSLGVLLFELLTGTTPVDRKSLGKAVILEVLRIVREVEAPRPSAKLSSSGTLPSVAANRGMEPAKLSWLLKRDLDWIVLKSLEKDRSRRYESANGLAVDVQRYLAGEAVQAHPPSTSYRLRKFARKNRLVLTTATAFVGLLIAAVAVSSWLAVKANRATVQAEDNADRATRTASLLSVAITEAEQARREAQYSAVSMQVDFDLTKFRTDPAIGLLRLVASLKELTSGQNRNKALDVPGMTELNLEPSLEFQRKQGALREFITAAILSAGQRFAPLMPPVTHDGHAVTSVKFSPDGSTLLTLGADFTARLWETPSLRQIAILREENEHLVKCDFSLDGRTIFTDDKAGSVRFWDARDGKFRASAQVDPKWISPKCDFISRDFQIGDNRLLLTLRTNQYSNENRQDYTYTEFSYSTVLWNSYSGLIVNQYNRSGLRNFDLQTVAGAKWITAIRGDSTVLVFSGEDGRPIGRFDHPNTERVETASVSPTGNRIATIFKHIDPINGTFKGTGSLRMWKMTPSGVAPEARANALILLGNRSLGTV